MLVYCSVLHRRWSCRGVLNSDWPTVPSPLQDSSFQYEPSQLVVKELYCCKYPKNKQTNENMYKKSFNFFCVNVNLSVVFLKSFLKKLSFLSNLNLNRVTIMVFNTNFNNIFQVYCGNKFYLWEVGVPGQNHRPVANH